MKRILIDGRFIGVGESMTRYCLEIVKGILDLDRENEYTLLIRPVGLQAYETFFKDSKSTEGHGLNTGNNKATIKQFRNLTIKVLDIPHYSIAEQTKLLSYLNSQQFDLVHFIQFNHPIRYRGKFVVTIHDLTLFGHLYREKAHKRLAFSVVMKSAVKNSNKILTISETSKKEIIEAYKVPDDKIEVTHLAVDDKYNEEVKSQKQKIMDFKEKYGIKGDYLLYTGMWKKHKNIIRMLKAFEQYLTEEQKNKRTKEQQGVIASELKQSIQLVLVGKIDKDEPEVLKEIERINRVILDMTSAKSVIASHRPGGKAKQSSGKNLSPETCHLKAIITTGFIDEAELPIAYAGALAYVIPSLSEGFGLPPLEAMACGTPVISSDVSAMPEILGDAPLYFDPYNTLDITKAMQKVLEDVALRQELTAKGLLQAHKYSWQQTAKRTLGVYEKVLSNN